MTGRRQPLSVLLLLVIVLSAVQVSAPAPPETPTNENTLTEEPAHQQADNVAQDAGDSGNEPLAAQEAVYPSSNAQGPRPMSEPTPETMSPTMFDYHHIREAQNLGSPAYNGSGIRAAVIDYGYDVGHPDLIGSQFIQPAIGGTEPYQGWPVAFDAKSMGIWLRDKKYEGTWYANTTRKGQPPFEVTHSILVDGRNDFGQYELLRADQRDNTATGTKGNKLDFDLTDLYVTHDEKFWFFGFTTHLVDSNVTYGLLIDVDNETSGTTSVPEYKLVNTNTTHTALALDDLAVNDVAVSPDGTMIATTASDKHVKVWSLAGARLYDLTDPSFASPYTLSWSPDNKYLAARDRSNVHIWDIGGGGKKYRTLPISTVVDIELPTDSRYSSSVAFSTNGTWLAVAAADRVYFYNVTTGIQVANMKASLGSEIRSVAFNPTNSSQLAVGSDVFAGVSNTVRIFYLNYSNLKTPAVTSAWGSASLGASAKILGVAWSPDGQRIVATSKGSTSDNTVNLFQAFGGTSPLMSSNATRGWVYAASWERTAAWPRFATVSRSSGFPPKSPLRLWDYNGTSLGLFNLNRTTYAVDWTKTGSLVTASLDESARIWSTSGMVQRVLVANKPDFAVMINAGLNYSLKDLKWQKVAYNGTFYKWNGANWGQGYEVTKPPINGTQAFFGVDEVFVEVGVPTAILGNPKGIAVEMFSSGNGSRTFINRSHAQDAVPKDGLVFDLDGSGKVDKGLDWSSVETPLSAFQYIPVEYYTVNTTQIPSKSRVYHFGYHPSPQLATVYGALGILVTDPLVAGNYTRVYIDMNYLETRKKAFDGTDVWVDRYNPVATWDDSDPDTWPDVSAGMIYFIADGVNYIPYSERYKTLNGIQENNKPENGALVAFAGEFRVDPNTGEANVHGTQVASIIASRGRVNPVEMEGVAPGVKLISILNGPEDVISSWYFAVEGYDGTIGTGDEAQIVVNPFEYPRTRDDGYDVYSRTADYLSTSYSGGGTVFFGPAGEEGFGYGTVASPAASPGIITVGRTVDSSLLSSLYGSSEGPYPHYKDIAFTSSRGPTVSGFPKPDFVAIGNTAVDLPLFRQLSPDKWGITGSEASAAVAAGVGALLMQADATLTAERMRNYLMAGAEDLGYDVLMQGAGFLNASRSMRLLLGDKLGASVHASPSSWVPGSYKASKPEAFTKMLLPGEGDQTTFTLSNRDTQTLSLTLSADVLRAVANYSFSNRTTQTYRDLFLWVNRSGVFVPDLNPFLPPVRLAPPLDPAIWNNSDLLKLTVYGSYSDLIVPSDTDMFLNMYCYDLILKDWHWDPLSDRPNPSIVGQLNSIDSLAQTSNVMEARIARPGREIQDSITIQLFGHLGNDGCKRANLEFKFKIEFYQRIPWSWMSLNPTTIPSLVSGQSTAFTATVTVPPAAAMGSYEAAIYVYDSANKHTLAIPVMVNVGANSPNFAFGGNLPSTDVTDLHDVNRVYGGRDLTLLGSNVRYYYLGDWRYFYVFISDEGINVAGASIKMVVQLNWTVKPSDLDLMALSPAAAADAASQSASMRFGPKPLREVVASEMENKPRFKTLSNESQDYVSFQLSGGLNVIGVREMLLNGDKHFETFSGSGMWWRIPREMRIATQKLNGTMPGSAMLSADLFGGLRASAVGPAITTKNSSEVIKLDWQDWMLALPFAQALAKGSYSLCLLLKKVLILDVHLKGLADVNDLDLGLFRDKNDDCKVDEATEATGDYCTGLTCLGSGPQWALDADGDADEHIKWVSPPDGYYIVKILGYDVPGGVGHFDLEVSQTLDTGTGYIVPEAPKPQEILQGTAPRLPAMEIVNFSMSWDFPGAQEDGNYSGAIQLGTANTPGVIVVPTMVILDRLAPSISNFSVNSNFLLVNTTNPALTNDPQPNLVVSFQDPTMGTLAVDTLRMVLDGQDVSSLITVTLKLEQSPFAASGTVGPWGHWKGDMSYSPIGQLRAGIHFLYVAVGDEARNFAHVNFTFTIDMQSPSLTLLNPQDEYTKENTTLIQGQTESNAYVQVSGQWHQVDSTGLFSFPVSLERGNNLIDVTAARWFKTTREGDKAANPVTIQKRVVSDNITPVFLGASMEPAGVYLNVETARVTGLVSDEIANKISLDPTLLRLTVNGDVVGVNPDGSFSVIVPLQEGQNTITMHLEDPAGNGVDGAPLVVTRDTIPPSLEVVNVPERVETGQVTIMAVGERGLTVKVNGFDAQETDGTYTKQISLSPGANLIVVKAVDRAKNVLEIRVSVVYSAPSGLGSLLFGPVGGGGAIAFMVILVLIVVLATFFIMRFVVGRGKPEEEVEEAAAEIEEKPLVEEEAVVEEAPKAPEEVIPAEEEVPVEEEVPKEPAKEEKAPEVEPVKEAVVEPPKPPEAPPPAAPEKPVVEEPKPPPRPLAPTPARIAFRVTRAKHALNEGKISLSVYQQNLTSLGLTLEEADRILEEVGEKPLGLVKPEPAHVTPPPEEKKGPSKEDKIRVLRKALEEGRISQEVYEENVKRLEGQ